MWALSQLPGLSWRFLGSFSWEPEELGDYAFLTRHGLAHNYAERAVEAIGNFNVDEKLSLLQSAGMTAITILHEEYPESLRHIYDPPLVLFMRGQLPLDLPLAAVVGSRKATPYGRQVVEAVVPPLVAGGAATVSGLARGIDTLAHVVTLRNGGVTIAVLGSGVDRIYPNENVRLAHSIVEQGGAVISEYPPGTEPKNYHFPARNRIISGLSQIVIVVEGDRNSGSLITAEHAMEQGRDVVAVPGSIFSTNSRGPNWLISQGATPLVDPAVPLTLLGITLAPDREDRVEEVSPMGRKLLECLLDEPREVDSLVAATALAVNDVLAELTALEMAGFLERLPGGRYIAVKRRLK
jgi:DNA processing protein